MAWQTAPGMIVIVGGFSLVGALYAGVDGLRNWIYHKVSQSVSADGHRCVCVFSCGEAVCFGGCTGGPPSNPRPPPGQQWQATASGVWLVLWRSSDWSCDAYHIIVGLTTPPASTPHPTTTTAPLHPAGRLRLHDAEEVRAGREEDLRLSGAAADRMRRRRWRHVG